MAQASIQRYFNTRKRPADDNLNKISKKMMLIEESSPSQQVFSRSDSSKASIAPTIPGQRIRSTRANAKQKLDFGPPEKQTKNDADKEKPVEVEPPSKKIVTFTQLGPMSPKKRLRSRDVKPESILKGEVQPVTNNNTNQKNIDKPKDVSEMTIKEIKEKITKSKKLADLKASLVQLNQLEVRRQELRKLNSLNKKSDELASPGKQLLSFQSIDLEIESPRKEFKTPEKVLKTPTPKKRTDVLMSPRQESIKPRKLLFSPAKVDPSIATSVPAFEKYKSLVSKTISLELPYKYRCLLELFKCCDTVCAMFFNRKERITFKKLKPAVQRMCRKNFTEDHLAQIKYLLPDAYDFYQHKMRNFGSVSKQDYFQLVITPLVKQTIPETNEEDLLNSQRLLERLNQFQTKLIHSTMEEHESFLKNLQPPMEIPREKLKCWHPDFDLESCKDINKAELPQPPNVEKFSSAKDILLTARNLFNCATPMERAMERLEAKRMEKAPAPLPTPEIPKIESKPAEEPIKPKDVVGSLLKGVPSSLLDKIRAKEAAKALSIMTRRPSAEKEAELYSRLPELARHIRNVFITEKKSCLLEEMVLAKIMNSYRASLTLQKLEDHLKVLSKETDNWITFLEIQKKKYIKMSRDQNPASIMDKLQKLASDKML